MTENHRPARTSSTCCARLCVPPSLSPPLAHALLKGLFTGRKGRDGGRDEVVRRRANGSGSVSSDQRSASFSLTSCGVCALIQTLHSQVGKEALEMGGFVSKASTKPAKRTKKR